MFEGDSDLDTITWDSHLYLIFSTGTDSVTVPVPKSVGIY